MRAFGAELEIELSRGGAITPDLLPRMIERARAIAAEPGSYFTDQCRNADSLEGYGRIGVELLQQLDTISPSARASEPPGC